MSSFFCGLIFIVFSFELCFISSVIEFIFDKFTKCEVIKYDVDDVDEELLQKYKIRNIPVTILVDENGEEIYKWNGVFNLSELEEKLDELQND